VAEDAYETGRSEWHDVNEVLIKQWPWIGEVKRDSRSSVLLALGAGLPRRY